MKPNHARLSDEFLNFEASILKIASVHRKNDPYILSLLSDVLCKLDRHDESLEIDRILCAKFPGDPVFRYNLACSYSQLKDYGRALSELELAIKSGFSDFKHLYKDKDMSGLIKLHEDKIKDIIIRHSTKPS